MTLTFGGIVAVGVVCSIGLAFLGGPLLSLVYGADIVKYLYLLQPLVFCAIITGVTWFVNDLLIALRNFRCTFIGSMVALGVSLAAMVPAQNLLGMNGVTAANVLSCLASSAFMMVCLSWQVRDRFKHAGGSGAADGTDEGEKGE
jgi:O-antigen/teichoic acid export membrane protein